MLGKIVIIATFLPKMLPPECFLSRLPTAKRGSLIMATLRFEGNFDFAVYLYNRGEPPLLVEPGYSD